MIVRILVHDWRLLFDFFQCLHDTLEQPVLPPFSAKKAMAGVHAG